MASEEGRWTKVGVIVSVLALFLSYVGLALSDHWPPFRAPSDPQASAPTPSGTSKPHVPPSTPSCIRKLRILSPSDGAIIANGVHGVLIKGTACNLGNDSGWLFDHDSQDGYYYDDYNGNTPIAVVSSSINGSWYFDDSPIGDPGDNHKLYTITLVLASPACNKALLAEPTIEGDYKLSAFPGDCRVSASLNVYVSYP